MTEHEIVRSILLRIARGQPATSPLASAVLEWAQPHRAWLLPGTDPQQELGWETLLAGIAEPRPNAACPQVLELASLLAEHLGFEPVDAALLRLMVACDRLARVATLARIADRFGHDLPPLLGELAGAAAETADRAARRSIVVRLGLATFVANRQGDLEVRVLWTLERLLDRAPSSGPEMIDTLIGKRETATLGLGDFAHVDAADLLVRILRGALGERAAGINILIHGPPGTGKTELARSLAQAAGAVLYAIGEADEEGDEPNRFERVSALRLAQRVLAGRGGAVLLFDEMEDLIGEARPSGGDWFARREGSKVFVNRLLEANPAPVIWTSNAIGNVDGAILRRMSFVLKLDFPNRRAAQAMLDRVAAAEEVEMGAHFGALLEIAPEAATVLRVSARAGRLAGESDGGIRPAEALVKALRGGELPLPGAGELDLDLFESEIAIDGLFASIRDAGIPDVSLLLCGPPGTGKTVFATHLARALDRPLLVKRASDLLSKWLGETEQRIAEAFAEARRREALLLLDEADSLLFDRATARMSWEVSQVNELLTWLDRHPLPVVAATNFAERLDPATLRRFVFKVELRPLGREKAARAFTRFFGIEAPASLSDLVNLTPGDFSVVARQLRHAPVRNASELVERLRQEASVKPGGMARIGF